MYQWQPWHLQARNGARVVVSGSLDLFSNKFSSANAVTSQAERQVPHHGPYSMRHLLALTSACPQTYCPAQTAMPLLSQDVILAVTPQCDTHQRLV